MSKTNNSPFRTVLGCSACGGDHVGLRFTKIRPTRFKGQTFTNVAYCPTNGVKVYARDTPERKIVPRLNSKQSITIIMLAADMENIKAAFKLWNTASRKSSPKKQNAVWIKRVKTMTPGEMATEDAGTFLGYLTQVLTVNPIHPLFRGGKK